MTRSTDLLADPLLTANIYCERRLDHFLCKAMAPFWRRIQDLETRVTPYLWFVRYGRCGEHVKLRLHGMEDQRLSLAALLTEAVESYFAGFDPPEPAARKDWSSLPPIDEQDEAEQPYPDRTLLWTNYRRSHVSLGGKPFLDHDPVVAQMTSSLSEGAGVVLSSLALNATGHMPHSLRQSILLKLLLPALQTLCPDLEPRMEYLAYHRDWLVRFSLAKRQADPSRAAEVLKYFSDQVATTAANALEPLTARVAAQWLSGAASDQPELKGWRFWLSSLRDHVEPLAAQPGYRLDPFATNPAFALYFKVLHGMANQVGLSMMDEAFTHHLLLHAAATAAQFPESATAGSGVTGVSQ